MQWQTVTELNKIKDSFLLLFFLHIFLCTRVLFVTQIMVGEGESDEDKKVYKKNTVAVLYIHHHFLVNIHGTYNLQKTKGY